MAAQQGANTGIAAFSSQEPTEYLNTWEQLKIKLSIFVHDRKHLNPSSLPQSTHRKPVKVELTPGETYVWCSCGQSKNQPFCDKSHIKTMGDFKPLKFVWNGPKKNVFLCACKMSQDAAGPKCDGSHRHIDWDNLDQYEPGFTRTDEWKAKIAKKD